MAQLSTDDLLERLSDEEPDYGQLSAKLGKDTKLLHTLLETAGADLKARLICLAGLISSADAELILQENATDPDVRIREAVALAAGERKYDARKKKLKSLLQGLLDDSQPSVRRAVLAGMKDKAVEALKPEITKCAQEDGDQFVRMSAQLLLDTGRASIVRQEVNVVGEGITSYADGTVELSAEDPVDQSQMAPRAYVSLPGKEFDAAAE